MTRAASGLLSDLVLVRMHGRSAEYLDATDTERGALVAACRREATVRDLAERILQRTIYAQAASRAGALRELVQNALDASPRGGRIDVLRAHGADADPTPFACHELTVIDQGRGMSRAELLEDLLVPFRTGKQDDPDAIGEHGIGFLAALEIAPRIEISTATTSSAHRLLIAPVGERAPYADFTWTLQPIDARRPGGTGTAVRLELDQPIDRAELIAELSAAAGFVDPGRARIFVEDQLINAARARLRRAARVAVGASGEHGELSLYVGHGEGVRPQLAITQGGLFVTARADAFAGPEHALHRELGRAIVAAGYGVIVDLPLGVPLNKGRTAAAAPFARAVDAAIVTAFERFVLEDALHDRELLRGVDHRLGSVLDRLVNAALSGDLGPARPPPIEVAGLRTAAARAQAAAPPPSPPPPADAPRTPTVAAPEEVIRFADALLDTPMFPATRSDPRRGDLRELLTMRAILEAHRAGLLRAASDARPLAPLGGVDRPAAPASQRAATSGMVQLAVTDPLAHALWRRLATVAPVATAPAMDRARAAPSLTMQRVSRDRLGEAAALPGVRALGAAMGVLERIDASISAAAGLTPSPISVHQDLYGPDEMAHTDGSGISVNLASARVRALLGAVLAGDDPVAFGALVDLLLHEKSHVSLATYVPRANAEHGASFYRRKDWLRRRLLEAIAGGEVPDPMRWLPVVRRGLGSAALPAPEALAGTFNPQPMAA